MTLDIQFKIKNNPNYKKYIRENSWWYKTLNRDPEKFKIFEEKVREDYKLRISDKVGKAIDTFELLQNLMSAIK
ncbi:MAG: YlbE-like family protein [Bacilli bacterium]